MLLDENPGEKLLLNAVELVAICTEGALPDGDSEPGSPVVDKLSADEAESVVPRVEVEDGLKELNDK